MTTAKPIAVLVGAIGKLPYAGITAYYLHYVRGLQELGYSVHYVERQNKANEYYEPSTRAMTDDVRPAVSYLAGLGEQFGAQPDSFTLLEGRGSAHGQSRGALADTIARADFVLTVADATWFDEMSACPRRAFVDGDPMFTQAAISAGAPLLTRVADGNPTLFSYGTRIGQAGCTIPDCGRSWLPTRPVVATSLWPVTTCRPDAPVTALLHWSAGSDVVVDGVAYGHKDREMERFMELPSRTGRPLVLAVGGRRAPRPALTAAGWTLVDPLESTSSAAAYRAFIAGSRADLGIAKHAYVASQSGWFSDRATCFLASGRPVLHQDTGFGSWLPETDGVLTFHDLAGADAALTRLDENYYRHAKAGRQVAEEYFEARTVIGQMLDTAGFR
jgi:hypothetical protein